jgi:undecaprenyl-diphosphatase
MIMDWLQALILGIIQGLTEFLPISSSGHLIMGKELLGLEVTDNIAFETVVHCATVLSTITILRKEIIALGRGFTSSLLFKKNKQKINEPRQRLGIAQPETQYIGMILLSMIPVMIVGLFFKNTVAQLFGEGITLVGTMLLVTALLLLLSSLLTKHRAPHTSHFKMSWGSALLMGIAQAVAVLPGLSRSGATIATGLLAGVKKEEVAKFSFLMVLIPILGETALGAMKGDFSASVSGIPATSLIIGFFAAYLCGCFACKFMIELIKRTNLLWFALYCCIAGIVALIYSLC